MGKEKSKYLKSCESPSSQRAKEILDNAEEVEGFAEMNERFREGVIPEIIKKNEALAMGAHTMGPLQCD